MTLFASLSDNNPAPKASSKRLQVLEFIRNTHAIGATCEEIERGLKFSHQSVSARICDLQRQKLIVVATKNDVAVTRTTKAGGVAFVWIAA